MARKLVVAVAGDVSALEKALRHASSEVKGFGRQSKAAYRGVALDAEKAAKAQIQASVRKDARLREEAAAFRHVAAASKRGSREQVTAANLAARAEAKLAHSLAATAREAKQSAVAASHANRQFGQLGRGALAGSGAFRSFGRSLAFASAGFLGGAGLTAAFTSTIQKAAQFERSLNVLQAVSHATAGQMRQVSAEAKRLGADVSLPATSAKDAAEAMLELSKANLSVKDSVAAARGSLQLAAAANITAGEAAAISARQLNAFELAGKEATRVADVLANAANSATGEIGDFAIAFQQSATIAHRFGLTVEDTAASLAVMANAGLVGSDAGTSFRVMLGRLVPQTKKASDLMDTLGIKWQDANGNLVPYRAQLVQYERVLKKLNPAQQQQALFTLFGSDAQRAANIILTRGVGAYDQMLKAVSRQGGAAKLAAAQNKGFTGALDALKSAIETTQITLGTLLLPTLTQYTRSAAKWLGDTKNQATVQRDFQAALSTSGEVLKTTVGVLRTAADVFGKFADLVGGAKNAVEGLVAAVVTVKLAGLIGELTGVGAAAGGATTKVGLLRSRLLGLPAAIPIVVGIEVAMHASGISKAGNKFLREHGLGFLAGDAQKEFPSVASLQRAVRSGGFNAQVAKQILAKLPSTTDQSAIETLRGTFDAENARGGFKGFKAPGTSGAATAGSRTTKAVGAFALPTGLAALSPQQRNEIARLTAEASGNQAGVLSALTDQRKILAGQITTTRKQLDSATGKEAEKLADTLKGLLTDDASALSQITSIQEAGARDIKSAADKATAATKKAAAAAKKAVTDRAKAALVGLSLHGHKLGVAGGPLTLGQVTAAMNAREQAQQFRALGLTSEGGERAPGVKGLQRVLGHLERDTKGTILDTAKTRSKFAAIRKVISSEFGKAGEDVRRTIKGMLDDIDRQLKDRSGARGTGFRHVSPNKLAQALGLGTDRASVRRAAGILSTIGAGGTVPGGRTAAFAGAGRSGITIHGGLHLHGVQDPRVLQEKLARLDGRRPQVRRGAR